MKEISEELSRIAKSRIDSRGRHCGITLQEALEKIMSEHLNKPNPFKVQEKEEPIQEKEQKLDFPAVMAEKDKKASGGDKPAGSDSAGNGNGNSNGNGKKGSESGTLEVPSLEKKDASKNDAGHKDAPADKRPNPFARKEVEAEKKEAPAPVEKKEAPVATDRAAESSKEKIDTKAIYEIQTQFKEKAQLEAALAGLYVKEPDGSIKPQADGTFKLKTEKVKDAQGHELEAKDVHAMITTRLSELHEEAIKRADQLMKNPEAVLGETMSVKQKFEAAETTTKRLIAELGKRGLDPTVGGNLDPILVNRWMEQNKDLSPDLQKKVEHLRDSITTQNDLQERFTELKILQDLPIITRHKYAESLALSGYPNAAHKMMEETKQKSEQLSSPAGRSEFMKQAMENSLHTKDESLSKTIQDKYLKNPDNPYNLISSAEAKIKANDIAGAKKDLETARTLAKKFDPKEVEKDLEPLKLRAENLAKERAELEKKKEAGTLTPNQERAYIEKEQKLAYEYQVLDAFRLAKPKADMAYASFLLNNDTQKDSEGNRKFARDILMNLRFDEYGKMAAIKDAENFDRNFDKAMNGSVNNRATMMAFNMAMQEHDKIINDARSKESNEEIAKAFTQARAKAEQARDIALGINRDSVVENDAKVRESLNKLVSAEMAKPAGERDAGLVSMLNEVMKPSAQQDQKKIGLLLEAMKDPKTADKAKVDELVKMFKDPGKVMDVIAGFNMLQEAEFQKSAVNAARMAMLQIDVNVFDKGENNTLVAEIEHDRFGADFIGRLDAAAGHDGRTAWGDIKEATRDLAWYESAWKWAKGSLKDIAISITSGVVGTLAAVGVGALTSWTGPGLIVAGGAAGFAAGAGTSAFLHKMCGDEFSWSNTLLDGVGGASGGVFASGRAVALGAGKAALTEVALKTGQTGLTTYQAFRLAGAGGKVAIALGGNRALASISASTLASATYRYPSEALTGNYKNTADWLKGSTLRVAMDTPTSVIGGFANMKFNLGGDSLTRQTSYEFLSNNIAKPRNSRIQRNAINAPLYDYFNPPAEQAEKK